MIQPPPLAPGDSAAVVSPAGPVTPDILEPGLELLESWGLEVRVDDGVYERHPERGYLAGTDRQRLDAVQRALDAPEVDAVIFSRGGYGTMRLLPKLDFDGLRESPKLLVGFSDLTALHLHVAGRLGVTTLHAPVVKSLRLHEPGESTLESLREALFGPREAPFAWEGLETLRGGRTRGPLLGGNLTLLTHMVASPYCPDLNGAVLLVEETTEEDYRLDRKLTGLRLAAKARKPAAIVLGDVVDCGGAYYDADGASELAGELAAEFDCPVVRGAPSGHESRNVAAPMGVEVEVDADAGRVEFSSDAARS